MAVTTIIIIASMLVALNGLLYHPKKDPAQPVSLRNISSTGILLFGLIILLAMLNLWKSVSEAANHRTEIKSREDELRNLQETNQHLIKVMSVADGYNANIRGTVTFGRNVTDTEITNALSNLFLKYVEIDLQARNKLGVYQGRVDYSAHPEVRKFLNLSRAGAADSYFSRYHDESAGRSYYFEIRCSGLKILNEDKIQYARFSPDEPLRARAQKFEWSVDFGRLYHVQQVFLDGIGIEELGFIPLNEKIYF